MEITPIGWILIPVGILLSVFYPAGLYALTIFFVPFTATSILNSGSGDSGSGIQPYMFFGLMLLIREIVDIAWTMKVRILGRLRKPVALYALFVAICGISLIMPMVINGSIMVPSAGLLNSPLEPLVFNVGRIKVFLGLVYGCLLTACIARWNLTPRDFIRTTKIYLISGVFVCLWGLFQLGLYFAKVPYPVMIFNNSASPNAGGYEAVLDNVAMRRVSSVSLEPSTLATTLIGMISLLVIPLFSRVRIFGKHLDLLVGTLMFVTLVLTTSSTGFLGLGALCLLLPFGISGREKLRKRILIGLVVFALVVITVYVTIPLARDFIQETILNKPSSYSAIERGTIVYIDFKYFLQYPFLGIGWGSAPTHDTIAGILSSCGLLGMVSFAAFVGCIMGELRHQLNALTNPRNIKIMSGSMFLSLCATLAAYIGSALPGGGTFYVITGLAIGVAGLRSDFSDGNSLVSAPNKT